MNRLFSGAAAPGCNLVALHCEEDQVKVARNQHPVTALEAQVLGAPAVDQGHDSVSAQAHDKQRRPRLGELAEAADCQRPDAGVNEGIGQSQSAEEPDGRLCVMPEEGKVPGGEYHTERQQEAKHSA